MVNRKFALNILILLFIGFEVQAKFWNLHKNLAYSIKFILNLCLSSISEKKGIFSLLLR